MHDYLWAALRGLCCPWRCLIKAAHPDKFEVTPHCGNEPMEQSFQKKREHLAKQRPLPPERRRALTLPLSALEPGDMSLQWTSEQLQSKLLTKLPFDVRTIIWEMAVGSEVLHIVKGYDRLGYTVCQGTEDLGVRDRCKPECRRDYTRTIEGFLDFNASLSAGAKRVFPLLRTCRIIYSEAIKTVYSQNIFDFDDLDTLIHFPVTVLPQRWNAIRSLRLAWAFSQPFRMEYGASFTYTSFPPSDNTTWLKACHVITTMTGLRNLTLNFHVDFWWRKISPERTFESVMSSLQPLRGVKVEGTFLVRVPWSVSEIQQHVDSEGVPYFVMSGNNDRGTMARMAGCERLSEIT
ncbi:MAG: hypothetical protein M1836_002613 [Candelina mexicana]|nr:MAG: hypothetical protein M1836_002613 [Candelina mexicana]